MYLFSTTMEHDVPKWMVDAVRFRLAKNGWRHYQIPYKTYQSAYIRIVLPEYVFACFGIAVILSVLAAGEWLYITTLFYVLCYASLGVFVYENKRISKIAGEIKAAEQTTETTPFVDSSVTNDEPGMEIVRVRYSHELETAIRAFTTLEMGHFAIFDDHIEGSRSSFERIMRGAMSQNNSGFVYTLPQWYNDCLVAVYGDVADVKV